MKTKTILLGVLAMILYYDAFAQVGIGNTNPQATLDVSASSTTAPANDDGILIPRMSTFPSAPGAARDGMLIFYTGTGASGKGFYYWNQGNGWIFLEGAKRIDELIDGKSDSNGTNDGSSIFLGINAGAADDTSDNRNVGIGFESLQDNTTGSNNTAIGYFSLHNNIEGTQNTAVGTSSLSNNTTGIWNTGIGHSALASNLGGAYNTALGKSALFSNLNGASNVALGVNALAGNTSGSFNTVIGVDAATGLTASGNTIIGRRAMNSYTAGGDNVAIGASAGYYGNGIQNTYIGTTAGFSPSSPTRDGSVFIGYGAGSTELASNKLYIENSMANSNNALIYGEFDNNILRVNGELQVGNPTGTGYAFPTVDGSAGEVLVTDGSGHLNYTDASTLFSADSDWIEVGSNIERQSGNVYIGDTNSTNNDLYISDRIIDWDNSTYYLDPNDVSRLGEIQIDNGTAGSPSLYFGSDTTTGIAGGVNTLRIVTAGSANHTFTHRGQLEFNYRQSVLLGNNAGDNLSASFNDAVLIGEDAGEETTSGQGNIALGRSALHDNTTGGHNVAMGSYTMTQNNGSENISIGGFSFRFLNSGSRNVAVGIGTGFRDVNSTNNTYIGHQAGGSSSSTNFDRTGNVFIGFQSGYNQNVNNRLFIENSNDASPLIYGEFDNDILRFNANVGIGRTPVTNALEIQGEASKTTAGAFVANSDRRLKKNIENIPGTFALEKISQMKGVTYEWNDNQTGVIRPEGIQYGFIAQNIQKVFPKKVTEDNLGFLQTAYGDYDPIVIEAIKALNEKIKVLETENNSLKEKLNLIESLEKRLLSLEENTKNSSTN